MGTEDYRLANDKNTLFRVPRDYVARPNILGGSSATYVKLCFDFSKDSECNERPEETGINEITWFLLTLPPIDYEIIRQKPIAWLQSQPESAYAGLQEITKNLPPYFRNDKVYFSRLDEGQLILIVCRRYFEATHGSCIASSLFIERFAIQIYFRPSELARWGEIYSKVTNLSKQWMRSAR